MDLAQCRGSIDPPEEFVEQIREALLALYDPSALQANPLFVAVDQEGGTIARIQKFRRTLLDAIEVFHPRPGVPDTSRAWRIYRILELRYIECNDVGDVIQQIALSKSQYHREHHYALQAVARILWSDRRDEGTALLPSPTSTAGETASLDSLRHEVSALQGAEGSVRAAPGEVIRSIAALLRPLCEKRQVTLQLALPENLPPLTCDRVALRQALLPIFVRVINGMMGGSLRVTAGSYGRRVAIALAEPGGALPADGEGLRREYGSLVAAIRGELSFPDPATPAGAGTILLTFPADDRPTLLVVDNHRDFHSLVERLLVGLDWDLVGATDVDQAYQLVHARRPAAIILDVMIPGHDGWDLLARLRESPSAHGVPVVICSVLDEPEMALALGAAAYLHKPIDRDRLVETL
ncbi:MAG TPA: response regulator, partial [Chloroflexota bacterium]|nr:response regulator [Chloroflexota bacterium]